MSNVNTGLVAGYVCEVRAAAVALASDSKGLRGFTDQGKYWSYFMDDVNVYPAAKGNAKEVTLDFCAELVLNMYKALDTMPLTFNSSERSISLINDGPSEPLCFIHFNGQILHTKLFGPVTEFNGVKCAPGNPKDKHTYKTGPCHSVIPTPGLFSAPATKQPAPVSNPFAQATPAHAMPVPAPADDTYGKLSALKRAFDEGILGADEYKNAKKQALGI